MKFFVFLFWAGSLVAVSQSWAAIAQNSQVHTSREKKYEIQTQLTLNEEQITNQKLTLKEGEKGTITGDYRKQKVLIEVLPTRLTKKRFPIVMEFTVSEFDEQGNKVVVATSKRIVTEKSPVMIDESEDLDHPKIDLSAEVTGKNF